MFRLITISAIVAMSLATSACGSIFYAGQQNSVTYRSIDSQMSEELRGSVRTVLVRPSDIPATLSVEGDYKKEVPTPGEGAASGASAGFAVTGQMIAEDPRGLLIAPIILPVAVIIGTIGGAAAAKIQQEIQQFRDELTDDLTENPSKPLGSTMLAAALRFRLEKTQDFEPLKPSADSQFPVDADAILEVRVTGLTIMVNGKNATMTTTAVASLRRSPDETIEYQKFYRYSQKDKLSNWVKDENLLWTTYVGQALRHFNRQISGDFFETILLRHVLRPTANETPSNDSSLRIWNRTVKTTTPILSWELFLLGDDPYGEWTNHIDTADVTYELEIYDSGKLVYAEDDIRTTRYEVQEALQECRTYHWSVRPHYEIDGKTRSGEWMQFLSSSERRTIRSAASSRYSATPDFWLGFPELTIGC